jgi:hypothetical protein
VAPPTVRLAVAETLVQEGQFRNYRGLMKIVRGGFPWEKTTKWPIASVYTNCETAVAKSAPGVHNPLKILKHFPTLSRPQILGAPFKPIFGLSGITLA